PSPSDSPSADGKPGFRTDIEGLRAVAVLLVMAYHAGFAPRHGFLGVDVFFVISGYLITGLLLRELATTGTISWAQFLGRRVRRLLPAAVVVLAVTALVSWFAVPGLRRHHVGTDIAAAALYVVNWVFAHRAVDYLSSDALPSPVQHYWSLSVEEQFYVVWPVALIVLAWVVRRLRRRPGAPSLQSVAWLLALICVPSFGYAAWLAHGDPAKSYFLTTTRAWELGVGAGLAVWCAAREPQRRGAVVASVGWAGLALVVGSAVWLPGGAAWPGPVTLAPTLGAAAVLYAGWAAAPAGPVRLLGRAPLVWVGTLSYSLYLWHWPVLTLTQWALGDLSAVQRLALAAVSVLPAWASYRFLEHPVHHSRVLARHTRAALATGAGLSAVGVLVAVPLLTVGSPFRTTPPDGADPLSAAAGARALDHPVSRDTMRARQDNPAWVVPDPQKAGEDRPRADVDHCQVDRTATQPVRCDFGVPGGRTTIALVGDSKAMQWLPALEDAAPTRGWRIVTYGKSSCAFADGKAALAGRAYPECDAWNSAVMTALRADPPDLVVTSGFATAAWQGDQPSRTALVAGLSERWQQVRALGSRLLVVADSPVSPDDLDVCAARHVHHLAECAFPRASAVAESALPEQQEAARVSGTALLDLTARICPLERCPVEIGNVTVHRPGDHLTATYVRTLAPEVAEAVEQELSASG
ncbi:MAG TPA: acyltransferase family protein, partial [Pedococcus sp.]